MPLYTYVANYNGKTVAVQDRRSNYRGWLAQVGAKAFPGLSNDDLGVIMRLDPQPVPNMVKTWSCSARITGGDFSLHVIETRG